MVEKITMAINSSNKVNPDTVRTDYAICVPKILFRNMHVPYGFAKKPIAMALGLEGNPAEAMR